MTSLNSDEKEAVRQFIDYGKDIFGFPTHKALNIALVLTGERDGCLIGVDSKHSDKLEEIFDGIVPYQSNNRGNQFYIGKSSKHIKKHNPASAGDREVGRFFGYPESAIEFYVENSDRVDQYQEFLESDNCPISPSEESDLFLIEYVPTPTPEGIRGAVNRQNRYEKTLKSLSVELSDANNFGIK